MEPELPAASEACREQVRILLGGQTVQRGTERFTVDYRSTETLDEINSYARVIAAHYSAAHEWKDSLVWEAVERVLTSVDDDDYEQRSLLAAKILLGYRATPKWDDAIPFAKGSVTLRQVRTERMGRSSKAEFETSITLRRAFVAPMLANGSTDHALLGSKRSLIWQIVDALLDALRLEIETMVVNSTLPILNIYRYAPTTPPHLASNFKEGVAAVPYIFAPRGLTFQAFLRTKSGTIRRNRFWSDRLPRDEETFIVEEARSSPVTINTLFRNARIRLLMERYDRSSDWFAGYGALPLLEAIQRRIEVKFLEEKGSLPLAVSLAQAVYLGRLILDPRTYSDPSEKSNVNLPHSTHFARISDGWTDAAILRSYNRWILDIGFILSSEEIEWRSTHYGGAELGTIAPHRGSAGDYLYRDALSDLARLSRVEVRYLEHSPEVFPTLEAMMYQWGYDNLHVESYVSFIDRVAREYRGDEFWLKSDLGCFGEPLAKQMGAGARLRLLARAIAATDTTAEPTLDGASPSSRRASLWVELRNVHISVSMRRAAAYLVGTDESVALRRD